MEKNLIKKGNESRAMGSRPAAGVACPRPICIPIPSLFIANGILEKLSIQVRLWR